MCRDNFVKMNELLSRKKSEDSMTILKRVKKTREIQKYRFKKEKFSLNSEMPEGKINTFCPLSDSSWKLLKRAINHHNLSARSFNRILKLARTISDTEEEEIIAPDHIAESIRFNLNILSANAINKTY